MGTVLVTGGKGFIGGHLVARLFRLGEKVRIFAHNPAKGEPGDGIETIGGDIRDPKAVEQAVEGTEKVFHLVSNFRKAGSDKKEAYAVNVEGTINVLKAAKKFGVKRLIHCSTIGVHGDVRSIPADESTPFNPGDLYQETKLTAEKEVWKFYEETGLPITVVRPISVYGPGDLRMLKLFRAIKKGCFVMIGEGNVLFHPAYIDDVIDGFILSGMCQEAIGEVFIVGGQGYLPLKDLVAKIAKMLGVSTPRFHVSLAPVEILAGLCERVCSPFGIAPPLHKRRVSFFKNNRAFSIDKARHLLGFTPKVPLDEGLKRTIYWYRESGYL